MNTPTPRTDAATYPADCLGKTLVTNRDCSRALERELTTLTAERDQLRADCENETKWAAHYLAESIAVKGERDQLRAENATLRAAQKACEACDEPSAFEVRQLRASAERAEANKTVALAKWNGALERAIKAEADLAALGQCHDDNCRAVVQLAAELATERARLDWLEDSSVCYHVCIDRQPDGYSIHNSPPSSGSVRAAIDAAMKEGAK